LIEALRLEIGALVCLSSQIGLWEQLQPDVLLLARLLQLQFLLHRRPQGRCLIFPVSIAHHLICLIVFGFIG
jgi:hypothetical protein